MNKTLTGKTPFDNLQQPLTNLSDGAEGLHTHKLGRFKMHQHCHHQLCQVTSDAFGSGKIFHRGQKDAEDPEHEGEAKLHCTMCTLFHWLLCIKRLKSKNHFSMDKNDF